MFLNHCSNSLDARVGVFNAFLASFSKTLKPLSNGTPFLSLNEIIRESILQFASIIPSEISESSLYLSSASRELFMALIARSITSFCKILTCVDFEIQNVFEIPIFSSISAIRRALKAFLRIAISDNLEISQRKLSRTVSIRRL